jgi:rhodanese-related sulfurtransferase
MSTQAAQDLVDAGVSGFYELEGGFIAWSGAGLPFEVSP